MACGALTCASASRRSTLVSCLHHFALEAAVAECLQIDCQVQASSSGEGRALVLLALELLSDSKRETPMHRRVGEAMFGELHERLDSPSVRGASVQISFAPYDNFRFFVTASTRIGVVPLLFPTVSLIPS